MQYDMLVWFVYHLKMLEGFKGLDRQQFLSRYENVFD